MIDKLLDFYNKKNTIDSLAFSSSNHFTIRMLLVVFANLILSVILYLFARFMCYLTYTASFVLAFVCFCALLTLTIHFFRKKIADAKKEFVDKVPNFLGSKCKNFEEYKIYNFLYEIGNDPYFCDDESFFKDLQEKCSYTISSFNHLNSIGPKAVLFYTSVASLITALFVSAFETFIKEDFRWLFIILTFVILIFYSLYCLKIFLEPFEFDINSRIFKYKSFQTNLKDAEMLHKKLSKLHGKDYLSKSIKSKNDKDNDLEIINAFFNDNNFSDSDMNNIKTYINNLIIANKKNKGMRL